ncbi:hypothetical protein [Clostridium sp.]|jgi:hypothetical protein|uniref:hypothetical protein n=1 Tax=Clostridium sp. TaxID=1506 RepID=UPI00258B914A|nr:hypothetical protein [Clostridium sp.]MDF2503879.1 hypothetical protein [Clostridium sp.]
MSRRCKCKYCNRDIYGDIFEYTDISGKKPKVLKMCSQKCVDMYDKEIQKKQKEKEIREELFTLIMQIHNQTYLPNYFYVLIGDLTNGTVRQKGVLIDKKNEKKGITWEDILNGYKYSEKTIRSLLDRKKDFNDITSELKYCLAIVKNNLPKAKQYFKQKKKIEKESKIVVDDIYINNDENHEYKKKDFKNDISKLL